VQKSISDNIGLRRTRLTAPLTQNVHPTADGRVNGVSDSIGWVEVDRDRVAGLYVSPSCSRRGVGSVLLALAETSILSSGYMTARLESSQNALNFYLRRGYIQCGPPEADGAWPLSKDLAAAVSVPITYEAPRRQEHTLKPTRLERFALAPAGR
jgi:hypothetical protein